MLLFSASSCAPRRPSTEGEPTSVVRASQAAAPGASGAAAMPADAVMPQILSREPWRYTTAEGEILRTTNYRLYTTTQDKVIRDRLAGFLEHALMHYRTAVTPLPPPATKLDTYLMNNRPQWERITKQLMGPQAETLLKIPRGGYASRGFGVFYDIGLFDTLAIAGHEGWHQFTQKTFQEPLPVWMEEGLATYMEGHRWEQNTPIFRPWANVQRFDQLRKAANLGQLLTLEELLDSRPQDFLDSTDDKVLTFYAQLWGLTHYLAESESGKYRASLERLVQDASAGRIAARLAEALGDRAGRSPLATRNGPAVFLTYFNPDLSAASEEYRRFLDDLVRTGSRSAVADGLSPIPMISR